MDPTRTTRATRIAKSPYWLTLREDASTCETRSETGDLPSFQIRILAVVPKDLMRKMSLLLPMDTWPQTGDGTDPHPLLPPPCISVAPWTFAMGEKAWGLLYCSNRCPHGVYLGG